MSWHAAAVHLPIGLAIVWPIVDLVGLALKQRAVSHTAVGLLVVAVLSSLVATATGQAEYDAAYAAGFGVELLDQHADLASLVPWALLSNLALRLYLPSRAGRRGRVGHVLAVLLGLGLIGLILQVGRTGGTLVYEHGVGVEVEAVGPKGRS